MPYRDENAHKHSCGQVVVVGGSLPMSGAPALVGLAALRSGAGVVKVLTTATAQPLVASFSPCLMVGIWPDLDLDDEKYLAAWAQHLSGTPVIALGPGLGREPKLQRLVVRIFKHYEGLVVVDADGLNLLADAAVNLAEHAGPRILTPHLGEFRRLNGDTAWSMGEAREHVQKFAKSHNVVALLKGPRTIICDGERLVQNQTGNAGMATAGSGDVLTGIISGLAVQGLNPFEATVTGAHLHGLAGDMAVEKFSQYSLIASDLIDWLPDAIKTLLPPMD
jgi:ADP-dependent NAD(P)H-hydrate dehydratase